jgi:hypothetical protein
MLVKGHGESPVLRKPELDAFLATAMSPELRNVTYLAEMRLEMVTIRGVHLAAIFMQVNKYLELSYYKKRQKKSQPRNWSEGSE